MRNELLKNLLAIGVSATMVWGMSGYVYADENEEVVPEENTTGGLVREESNIEEPEIQSEESESGEYGGIEGIVVEEEVTDEASYAGGVAINSTNFPDVVFRTYIKNSLDMDSNGYLSNAEITHCSTMYINGYNYYISDFKGLEYLTSISYFIVDDCNFTSFDLNRLPNDIEVLGVIDAGLNNLDLSRFTSLRSIFCAGNKIDVLDVSCCPRIVQIITSGEYNYSIGEYAAGYLDNSDAPDEPWIESWDLTTTVIAGDRIIPAVERSSDSGTVSMYRLYNPNSGEHFYTSSADERNMLVSVGWNYEGIGWVAPATSNTPVYRLYNRNGGEHHYTMSVGERDALVEAGWEDEGIGWYSDDSQRVPLYRQYNPNAFANNHNYTTSIEENNNLVSIGWRPEGIGWYGVG